MNYLNQWIGRISIAVAISNLTVACGPQQNETQQASAPPPKPAANAPQAKVSSPENANLDLKSDSESYDRLEDNSYKLVKNSSVSTFSIDVDTASYSNIRRFIDAGQLPPKDAVRLEEMINYFNYDYPQPKNDTPFSVSTEISQAFWNPDRRLVQIGLQAKRMSTEDLPASNLVFLLDVSGSMEEPNKLPLLKSALQLLVNQLRAKDRVSIVVYAGSAGLVLPATPGDRKEKILTALDKLQAGGSTAGGEGIQLAYKIAKENFIASGNNRIILATDGDFNVGMSGDDELVNLIEQKRKENIFLSVIGLGMGNLKDAKMEKLADKGNGNYAYIDSLSEAKKVLVKQIGGTLVTVAKDVKIQVEFNPAKVQAYRLIGYENRVLANQDFNDDRKDAGELGVGHSVTALYELVPVGAANDKFLSEIDNQKSEPNKVTSLAYAGNELMQIKFRYKLPNKTESQLLTIPVEDKVLPMEKTSNNFKFASAVAAYGMLLRDSQFKGQASYDSVLKLANESQGSDLDGYRAEFIRLVQRSKNLPRN